METPEAPSLAQETGPKTEIEQLQQELAQLENWKAFEAINEFQERMYANPRSTPKPLIVVSCQHKEATAAFLANDPRFVGVIIKELSTEHTGPLITLSALCPRELGQGKKDTTQEELRRVIAAQAREGKMLRIINEQILLFPDRTVKEGELMGSRTIYGNEVIGQNEAGDEKVLEPLLRGVYNDNPPSGMKLHAPRPSITQIGRKRFSVPQILTPEERRSQMKIVK
jgi:hypothetical protein